MIFIYVLSGLAIVLYLFYKWLDSKISILFLSAKKGTGATPEDYKLVYEPIFFKSEDGLDLSGWFVPSKNFCENTVIICHEFNQNKSDMLKDTIFLSDNFNLFYFDFRAYGESKGNISSFGIYETKDVLGAVEFLKKFREEFSKKIFVYAPSFSSITVSKLNNGMEKIDGVVLFKPVTDYYYFIKSVSQKFSIPFLPEFFIKKYIKSKNIKINDKITSFSFPVAVITDPKDKHLFDCVKSDYKTNIELTEGKSFSNALSQALINLSGK
ncbi:MAG: hypothetical protein N2Z60_08775 [Elusimicrobiales bacterium]|nr:hypothetical protein [Elusimicrobiales bacterium]